MKKNSYEKNSDEQNSDEDNSKKNFIIFFGLYKNG